jgi:hypothetical protein
MMNMSVVDNRGLEKMGSRRNVFENTLKSDFSGSSLYMNYQYSRSAMEDLGRIVHLCQKKKIRLNLFISPSHATEWESIRLSGAWSKFENWKRDIAKLHPVWDFSGYNSVTTEPIQKHMQNYMDSSHYTPHVGSWILEKMSGFDDSRVPGDFGVLLNPENIESHFAKQEKDRQNWVRLHADLIDWLKKLQVAKQDIKPSDTKPIGGLAKNSYE